MADHEDYLPGESPTAHKTTHQDGGTDEISVSGLSGETAELSAHKILPSIHHIRFTAAEARAAINNIFGSDGKADVDIDLDNHRLIKVFTPFGIQDGDTLGARNDAISTHAGLATVHQDAPALILTHKGDAGAHHAKYTDAEVRALFSPISIPPSAFIAFLDTYDWIISKDYICNRSALTSQIFLAPVIFPTGVTVTKVTLYGSRNDADAVMNLQLLRSDREGNVVVMTNITAGWTDGYNNGFDDSIVNPVIDNTNYQYCLQLILDPDTAVGNVLLSGVKIEFTG